MPNFSAYCETCSSTFCALDQRMFQLTGDAQYIDVLDTL
ncbi:MAG: glycoside hydrolase family 127 protein [Lewinellaceae bacterium]|nr:glycoside hydrolase family 127 protein [Lewinellaceae bacterium]